MPRKKKYENALIVKDILARESQALGNMQASIMYRFIDLKKKDDREFLKEQTKQMIEIFNNAVKELEGKEKKNESNDKHADESEEKNQKSKSKKKK